MNPHPTPSSKIQNQLVEKGIQDPRVIAAFDQVPRDKFVPADYVSQAYEDRPIPIGHQVTISQPYVVAKTLEEAHLSPGEEVLEIGTGSGYQTALLATLGVTVYTIERIESLALRARQTLEHLGLTSIHYHCGDGHLGWPESHRQFDAILLTAAPESIPQRLLDQLKIGGRLVGPVGNVKSGQWLVRVTRNDHSYATQKLLPVRFVPMVKSPPK